MAQYIKYMMFFRYILLFFGILSLVLGYHAINKVDSDPQITGILNYYHTHKPMFKNLFNTLENVELNFSCLYKDKNKWELKVNNKYPLIVSVDSIAHFLNHSNINESALEELDYIRKISGDSIIIGVKKFNNISFLKKTSSSEINLDNVIVKKKMVRDIPTLVLMIN